MLEEWFGCIFMLPLIDCLKAVVAVDGTVGMGGENKFLFLEIKQVGSITWGREEWPRSKCILPGRPLPSPWRGNGF